MMYLMEGRKLLYAQVFNGRQKLLTLPLQAFFCGFLRVSFLFTRIYILGVKKHSCSASFCRKNDSRFDRKKEFEAMRQERELLFVICILDIDYSLNSIINWIAWKHNTHMQWWSRNFNKGEILAPSHLNILSIFF